MNDPLEPIGLHLKMIQDSPQTWSINKSLAFRLSMNQFMTVGEFFKTLAQGDLDFLVNCLDSMLMEDTPQEKASEIETELLLLACMLSIAEGLDIKDDADELLTRSNILMSLITSESLFRKGFVNLKHENMSFGEDSYDLELASLTDAGRLAFAAAKGSGE